MTMILTDPLEIEELAIQTYHQIGVEKEYWDRACILLGPLKLKHEPSYLHSLRVGITGAQTILHGAPMYNPKPLFYSGILHDAGKAGVKIETLAKTKDWTPEDAAEMRKHVELSYYWTRDLFDFSAEIIILHHWFQENGYPETLPNPLHNYSRTTITSTYMYGRLLSMLDVYDALHRGNDRFGGELSNDQIRERMFILNPDLSYTVEHLYNIGVLQ